MRAAVKLGIGTVQFGLDYGISNKKGKTQPDEVRKILLAASENGIQFLDTAHGYGSSEEVLGKSLQRGHGFSIVTKTPPSPETADSVEKSFFQSLSRLSQQSVYGLLAHHAEDLLLPGGELVFQAMQNLKQRRLAEKIGVSVYTADEIDRVLERYPIDLIQVPVNLLDQRLLRSGHLERLKKAGIEIHARSVFLQGLLLMDPAELPGFFNAAKPVLARFREAARRSGMTLLQAAIHYVMGIPEIDVVLCGVNNHLQLKEICGCLDQRLAIEMPEDFSIHDGKILNPAHWPK